MSEVSTGGKRVGKNRETKGLNVLMEAQVIAALSSMQVQSATQTLSHVGSVPNDAPMSVGMRNPEITQTLVIYC
jgi:hypothetical protein